MGTMNIQIYGREYPISCDDGQEAHLGRLAQVVNERIRALAQQMGRGPEAIMLIYTALMLADELEDSRKESAKLRNELKLIAKEGKLPIDSTRLEEMELAMAASMEQIAGKLEQLAEQLEAA
jgi:cell division protein ZapA